MTISRRSFIKRSAMLLGAAYINPLNFIQTGAQAQPIAIQPSHVVNPLTAISKIHSEPLLDPSFKWISSSSINHNYSQIFYTYGIDEKSVEQHNIEIEMALLFSIKSARLYNERPTRTTLGLIPAIGALPKTFTMKNLEKIFRYGSLEKVALVDKIMLSRISRNRNLNLIPGNISTIKTAILKLPFGKLHLILHPLFKFHMKCADMMIVFAPDDLVYRYIYDTKLYDDFIITECGLEYHNIRNFGYLIGGK